MNDRWTEGSRVSANTILWPCRLHPPRAKPMIKTMRSNPFDVDINPTQSNSIDVDIKPIEFNRREWFDGWMDGSSRSVPTAPIALQRRPVSLKIRVPAKKSTTCTYYTGKCCLALQRVKRCSSSHPFDVTPHYNRLSKSTPVSC